MFPYSQPGSPPYMPAGSPPPAPYEAAGSPPPFGGFAGNAFDMLTSAGGSGGYGGYSAMSPGAGPGPGSFARAMSPGASSASGAGSARGRGRGKAPASRGGAASETRGRGRGSRGGPGSRGGRGGKKAGEGNPASSPPPAGPSSPPPSGPASDASTRARGRGRGRGTRPRGTRGRGRGRGASAPGSSWATAGQSRRTLEGEEDAAGKATTEADGQTRTQAATSSSGQAAVDGEVDGEQDGEAEEGDELLQEDELTRQENLDKHRKKVMGLLMSAMTEEQYDQHEAYRRARLQRPAVKRIINHWLAQSVTDNVATVVAGVGKVFVGEIVESARAIMKEMQEDGPIQPHHLLEAHRRYKQEREKPGRYPIGGSSGAPGLGKKRKMF